MTSQIPFQTYFSLVPSSRERPMRDGGELPRADFRFRWRDMWRMNGSRRLNSPLVPTVVDRGAPWVRSEAC